MDLWLTGPLKALPHTPQFQKFSRLFCTLNYHVEMSD